MPPTRDRPLRAASDAIDDHPLEAGLIAQELPTERVDRRRPGRDSHGSLQSLDWRQALGGGLIGLGVLAVVIAWFGVSGTLDPGEQMPYISSGGFGGSALIAIGVTLLVSFEHVRDREALRDVLEELDELRDRLDAVLTVSVRPSNNGS